HVVDVPWAARDIEDRVALPTVAAAFERAIERRDAGEWKPRARVAEHDRAHGLEKVRDARLDDRVIEIADDAERSARAWNANAPAGANVGLCRTQRREQAIVNRMPISVDDERRRQVDPLAKESFVIGEDLTLHVGEPHADARMRESVAVDAFV